MLSQVFSLSGLEHGCLGLPPFWEGVLELSVGKEGWRMVMLCHYYCLPPPLERKWRTVSLCLLPCSARHSRCRAAARLGNWRWCVGLASGGSSAWLAVVRQPGWRWFVGLADGGSSAWLAVCVSCFLPLGPLPAFSHFVSLLFVLESAARVRWPCECLVVRGGAIVSSSLVVCGAAVPPVAAQQW